MGDVRFEFHDQRHMPKSLLIVLSVEQLGPRDRLVVADVPLALLWSLAQDA